MDSPRRVLFVIGVPQTIGFVAPLAIELRARGIGVALAVGASPEERVDERAFDTVFRIRSFRRASPVRLVGATRSMVGIIKAWQPDLLHLHTPYGIALGRVAARLTGTDHVAVVHGSLFDTPGSVGATFRSAESAMARFTPHYVAVNKEDAAQYRHLAPRSDVLLAPCGGAGIDISALQRHEPPERDQGQSPHILVLGRFTPDKGLDLCVAAWERLREHRPDIELRFVGGSLPSEPAWVPPKMPGLQVAPFTETPGAEICAAALLLSCSGREGFSMVVAESLLLGVPVVAVSNRGTREIASLGVDGLTLVDADAHQVARAMLEQLERGAARVPPEVRSRWTRESVIQFHADLVLSQLDAGGA